MSSLTPRIDVLEKNYIINGNFGFWQRTSAAKFFGAEVTYHADRFAWAAGTITGQVKSESLASSNYSNSSILPKNCGVMQRYEVTTAQASLSAGSTAGPWYKVEGYDFAHLLQNGGLERGISLSFYVASSVTGTYAIELANSDFSNRIFKTYSISSSGSWSRITLSLTAAEVAYGIASGNWNYLNNTGLLIRFWLASGSSSFGVNQDVWNGSSANVPSSHANFLSAVNNTWGITGIMLYAGTKENKFITRGTREEETKLCQRYFEKSYNIDTNVATNTSEGMLVLTTSGDASGYHAFTLDFKVAKRSLPTIAVYRAEGDLGSWKALASNEAANAYAFNGFASVTIGNSGHNSAYLYTYSYSSYLNGFIYGHFTADAEL